jgi:hypothetical protein
MSDRQTETDATREQVARAIAKDVATWLRVHADADWTAGHEAVQLLSSHLADAAIACIDRAASGEEP